MSTPPVESTNNPREGLRSLVAYCLERGMLLSSVKTALVLGTLLALINDGQAFFTRRVASDLLFALFVSYWCCSSWLWLARYKASDSTTAEGW